MARNLSSFDPDVEVEEEIDIAPAAKKLAAECGINYENVKGTGKSGRILKRDVQKVAQGTSSQPVPEPSDTQPELPFDPPMSDLQQHTDTLEPKKSFGVKIVCNFGGQKYHLVDFHTDAFGTMELIFDQM